MWVYDPAPAVLMSRSPFSNELSTVYPDPSSDVTTPELCWEACIDVQNNQWERAGEEDFFFFDLQAAQWFQWDPDHHTPTDDIWLPLFEQQGLFSGKITKYNQCACTFIADCLYDNTRYTTEYKYADDSIANAEKFIIMTNDKALPTELCLFESFSPMTYPSMISTRPDTDPCEEDTDPEMSIGTRRGGGGGGWCGGERGCGGGWGEKEG